MTTWLYIIRLSQQPGFHSQARLHTPQVSLFNTCRDKNYLCYIKARFPFYGEVLVSNKGIKCGVSLFCVGSAAVWPFSRDCKATHKCSLPSIFIALCLPHVFPIKKRKMQVLEILIICFYKLN